jgi:hypothetical protein
MVHTVPGAIPRGLVFASLSKYLADHFANLTLKLVAVTQFKGKWGCKPRIRKRMEVAWLKLNPYS